MLFVALLFIVGGWMLLRAGITGHDYRNPVAPILNAATGTHGK